MVAIWHMWLLNTWNVAMPEFLILINFIPIVICDWWLPYWTVRLQTFIYRSRSSRQEIWFWLQLEEEWERKELIVLAKTLKWKYWTYGVMVGAKSWKESGTSWTMKNWQWSCFQWLSNVKMIRINCRVLTNGEYQTSDVEFHLFLIAVYLLYSVNSCFCYTARWFRRYIFCFGFVSV